MLLHSVILTTDCLRLIESASEGLGIDASMLLQAFGCYWPSFLARLGYGKLLRGLGSNIAELAHRLNDLHLNLQTAAFPSMRSPTFRVENVTPTSLHLIYASSRRCLWPFAAGILTALAADLFEHELVVQLVHSKEADHDHDILLLKYPYQASLEHHQQLTGEEESEGPSNRCPIAHNSQSSSPMTTSMTPMLPLTPEILSSAFPFHFVLDSALHVIQAGPQIVSQLIHLPSHTPPLLTEIFSILNPFIDPHGISFESIQRESKSSIILQLFRRQRPTTIPSPPLGPTEQHPHSQGEDLEGSGLKLKGQFFILNPNGEGDGGPQALFLGSPHFSGIEELCNHNLTLNNLSQVDKVRS